MWVDDMKAPNRKRVDTLLVERGFFDSRSAAQAAISAGMVRVDGADVLKPSTSVAESARIEAQPAHPYVSRGGVKLAHAIDHFGLEISELVCLDLGSSTGGFTQVLVERGAAHVTAVDVGRGQFHANLREHERITLLEGMDARELHHDHLPLQPQIIVADLSFIGLEKVLGPALSMASPDAQLVTLFKPQFQVGREHVGKGGIVTNEIAARNAEQRFVDWLGSKGWFVAETARIDSPITGGDGNRERLLLAVRKAP